MLYYLKHRIEFQNVLLNQLPREAVLLSQFCAKATSSNEHDINGERCLAWGTKAFFDENL